MDDDFSDDFGSDADALASIGWGTDEDYGYYGEQYSIAPFGPRGPLSDLYQHDIGRVVKTI